MVRCGLLRLTCAQPRHRCCQRRTAMLSARSDTRQDWLDRPSNLEKGGDFSKHSNAAASHPARQSLQRGRIRGHESQPFSRGRVLQEDEVIFVFLSATACCSDFILSKCYFAQTGPKPKCRLVEQTVMCLNYKAINPARSTFFAVSGQTKN